MVISLCDISNPSTISDALDALKMENCSCKTDATRILESKVAGVKTHPLDGLNASE